MSHGKIGKRIYYGDHRDSFSASLIGLRINKLLSWQMPIIVEEKWVHLNFQEIKSSCISHNGKREIEQKIKTYKIHPYACELEERTQMHKNNQNRL